MPRSSSGLSCPALMTASLPPAAMPDCQSPASASPVSGSVNAASTARQAAVRERDSYCKSPAERDGAPQPAAGGPLPWHLHVTSTGSTAGLHTGLVGCGDIDDGGGMGQSGHDPAGIAAAGLVDPGWLCSDPLRGRNMIRAPRPGPA